MITPIKRCPNSAKLTVLLKSIHKSFASPKAFTDTATNEIIYYGEKVDPIIEDFYFLVEEYPSANGNRIS